MYCASCKKLLLKQNAELKFNGQSSDDFCSDCLLKSTENLPFQVSLNANTFNQKVIQKLEIEKVDPQIACPNHDILTLSRGVCLIKNCPCFSRLVCSDKSCQDGCPNDRKSLETFFNKDKIGPDKLMLQLEKLAKKLYGFGFNLSNLEELEMFISRKRDALLTIPIDATFSEKTLIKGGILTNLALNELEDVLMKSLESVSGTMIQNLLEEWSSKDQSRPKLKVQLRPDLITKIERVETGNKMTFTRLNDGTLIIEESKEIHDESSKEVKLLKASQSINNEKNVEILIPTKDLEITVSPIIEIAYKNSKILKGSSLSELLHLIKGIKKLKLLYANYGEDKEYAEEFHQACDGAKETIVVGKFRNFIAGGYSDQSWEGEGWKASSKAFLFSLNRQKIYKITNTDYAVFCNETSGPIFGRLIKS